MCSTLLTVALCLFYPIAYHNKFQIVLVYIAFSAIYFVGIKEAIMQVDKFVVSFKQLEIVNVDFIVVVAKQKLKISPQPPPCQPCTH